MTQFGSYALESIPTPPIVMGATGGSGTRVVARIARRCGLYGTRLNVMVDILAAFGFDVCSDGAFVADACGTGSDLGNAAATVPPLPPDFTGDVYRVNPRPVSCTASGWC